MIIRHMSVGLFALLLVGCGSAMTVEECKTADWYQQGLMDGTKGEPRDKVNSYGEACLGSGINPDREQYSAGYAKGLEEFCTYGNGLERGTKGGAPHECPENSDYRDGYAKGIKKYAEERERRELEKLTRHRSNNRDFDSPSAGEVGP